MLLAIVCGLATAEEPVRKYNAEDATDALEKYSDDANPKLRILSVQMMGELGGANAAKTLRKMFDKERDGAVRRAILLQLVGVLPEERDTLDFYCRVARKDNEDDIRYIALNEASLIPRLEKGSEALADTCFYVLKKDKIPQNRGLAAVILRELGENSREISALVLEALFNPAAEIRRRAASALGTIEGDAAFQKILEASNDRDPEVRAALCRALSAQQDKRVIPILKSLLTDSNPQVRQDSLTALSAFAEADAGLATFVLALSDKDPTVRLQAVGALEKYGNPSAVSALEKTASEDPDGGVRQLAKTALVNLKSPK